MSSDFFTPNTPSVAVSRSSTNDELFETTYVDFNNPERLVAKRNPVFSQFHKPYTAERELVNEESSILTRILGDLKHHLIDGDHVNRQIS